MFTKAIVRRPCSNFGNGLTTANLGKPDIDLARIQHDAYVNALVECGLEITSLPALSEYPDSTFVEDVALLTRHCVIITNPGAESRRGEANLMRPTLEQFFRNIYQVESPGTVDAGDIMMVGDHYYIGLSSRTNSEGATQLINFLNKHNLTGETIIMDDGLHLKSSLAYLENNNLVAYGGFNSRQEFSKYNLLSVTPEENYAANCVWVNGNVLVANGFPQIENTIKQAGYNTIVLGMSEFQKLDGGLSCLSLRF